MFHTRSNIYTGSIAPNFQGTSASGPLRFHQWIEGHWAIVFALPVLSLPSEFTEVARRLPEIDQRDVKVVCFVKNQLAAMSHRDILLQHYSGTNVQIIADDQGKISNLYGMSMERNFQSIRNTMCLIDPMKTVRSVSRYPSSLSTELTRLLNFVELSSEPLPDIPTEMLGLDGQAKASGDGPATTIDVLQAAAGVIEEANDISSSDGSNNAVAEYIQHAMTVMDALADLGAVMPFVAPAFVLIKTIIAVEQRARDVDAKCTDLVQRVTFMLSHLPALKKIQVTNSTRQVLDRMNETLKQSAVLIQTYRKQGVVARRLSIHNKDRFASCALSLKECTNDLMISLQIHQSTQLDILTRPIPLDPEDEAAANFVTVHGGLDAVKGNKELVKQFASEMKLSIDDQVMEQLNTNISAVLQENQDRLEKSLNDSVSTSVVEGIRSLATQMKESAKEQKYVCVQCNKEYRESSSGEKSCSFHRAGYDSHQQGYSCCGTRIPCQFGRHRSGHHCDYPYGNFFTFYGNIVEDYWVQVEDRNLETSAMVRASAGRVRRWVRDGDSPELPTIFISVGMVVATEPHFFKTFNSKDLGVVSKVIDITHQTFIFRTSPSEEEFAMAEWVLSLNGIVEGVRITVKVASSPNPFIRLCPIDITTCTLSGEVGNLSEGGFRAYKPHTPHALPEIQRVSGSLHEGAPRAIRKFKAQTSPNLPVVLKPVSDPPLEVDNEHYWSACTDNFIGTVSVFNKHPANSMQPISIASVAAFYRFIGDKEYRPAKSIKLLDGIILPVSLDPRQTCTLKFVITVPYSKKDTEIGQRWIYRAFIARQRPLRIKLVLTDIEDEECSLVLDYVCPAPEKQEDTDNIAADLYVEDPFTWRRYGVRVTKDTSHWAGLSIYIGSRLSEEAVYSAQGFTADWMKTTVYKALKSGESEIALGNEGKGTKAWTWKAWALVDLSCQLIYAFKILITKDIVGTKGYACLKYVPCPEYTKFYDETRPIRYATETVKFPELEPYIPETLILDDEFDDSVPEALNAAAAASQATATAFGLPGSHFAYPNELSQRLASIDNNLSQLAIINNNLSRLSSSIEQLVDILKAK